MSCSSVRSAAGSAVAASQSEMTTDAHRLSTQQSVVLDVVVTISRLEDQQKCKFGTRTPARGSREAVSIGTKLLRRFIQMKSLLRICREIRALIPLNEE